MHHIRPPAPYAMVGGSGLRRRLWIVRRRCRFAGAFDGLGVLPVLIASEHEREQPEHHEADAEHHDECHHRDQHRGERAGQTQRGKGKGHRGHRTLAGVSAEQPPGEGGALLDSRGGRLVFRARRPAALVVPLAAVTELGGVLCLVAGAPIGWFIVAAPLVALLVTALLFRPTLELTRDGLLQRQYPFSSLTRWEVIADVGITRAGNRVVLGYKLTPGVPPPRRQPAASLLRAAGSVYDGGYFADSLAGKPDEVLSTVRRYLDDPSLRATLPPTKR